MRTDEDESNYTVTEVSTIYEKYLPTAIIGATSLLLLIAVLICVIVKRKKEKGE